MFKFLKRSPNLPTDLEILKCIYNTYYSEFTSFKKGEKRITKIYVPIDSDLIGKQLGVDGDIPFGRLRYHLVHQHKINNNEKGSLFELKLNEDGKTDINIIHFPFLASILAQLIQEDKKHTQTILIAWLGVGVSFIALIVSAISLIKSGN